jgi:hypothetical protein
MPRLGGGRGGHAGGLLFLGRYLDPFWAGIAGALWVTFVFVFAFVVDAETWQTILASLFSSLLVTVALYLLCAPTEPRDRGRRSPFAPDDARGVVPG